MRELNIVSGEVLYKNSEKLNLTGKVIPFNEAICQGDIVGYPFEIDFIKGRIEALSTTESLYNNKVLSYINEINQDYDKITLWFDTDMFCQINILCLLTYLERINYQNSLELVILDDDWHELNRTKIKLKDYSKIYEKVLWNKELITTDISIMNKGITLYLNYKSNSNEIIDMIKENISLPQDVLVKKLLTTFKQYGLGDIQYLELINQAKDK